MNRTRGLTLSNPLKPACYLLYRQV